LRKQGNKNIMFNDTLNPRSDPQMTQMDTDDKTGTDYVGLLFNGSEWVSKMRWCSVGRRIEIPLAERERYNGTVLHRTVQNKHTGCPKWGKPRLW